MQLTKSTYNIYKYIAFSSFALILLGGVFMLQPFSFTDSANAGTNSSDISINIGESIMVPEVSADTINLDLDPDVNGDYASDSVTVNVSTNRVSGYTLTMSTEGTETALTSDTSSSYQIDALSAKTSATDFSNLSHAASVNKWGFATDNNGTDDSQTEAGYFYPITSSTSPTTIKITDGPANTSNTQVTFATKGKDLAAGTYGNTIVFSVVGNAIPNYLQDFTAEKCNALTAWGSDGSEGDTITLTDKRDKNDYMVRKLADGHCWMVTNLKLAGGTKLTKGDSDITDASWTLPANISSGFNSTTTAQMHVGTTSDCTNSNCWVSAWGNYYNWTTATAGQGTNSTSSGNINVSICPKGWKLPLGTTADYSWYYLYNTGYGGSSNLATFQTATNTSTGYWSGNYSGSRLYNAGSSGRWWSRTAYSASFAYYSDTNSSSVNPQASSGKDGGLSVRCVLTSE